MKSAPGRDNILKTIRFERPDYIPMTFAINAACYKNYDQEALFDLMEAHPFLFPGFVRPALPFTPEYAAVARKDKPYIDDWGCRWETSMDGITGTVLGHPLADWDAFETYRAPDPTKCRGIGPIDWDEQRKHIATLKELGHFTAGGLRHGHTFLQVTDIRGYQNVLFDMMDEEPNLEKLLDMITEFNLYIVKQYADMNVDMLTYAEDLGMQVGPMVSPENLRKYIMPCYKKLMQPAKEKDIIVHMHSDGDIRTLIPILLECGVDIFNLQDLVNGIDWIKDNLKNKVCIELDVDRQKITTFGTPKDIDRLIREEVSTLGSREGGLMMVFGLYPGTPLENVKALMDAMEKYAFYFN